MPVAEMRTRISYPEWIMWSRHYARKAQQRELANKMAG